VPDQDSDRRPKTRRARAVVAAALILLGLLVAIGAVVLQGAYWVAFLALLITGLVAALTNLKDS
jgi:fatty acid desaturase